jgi:hypothetical protein
MRFRDFIEQDDAATKSYVFMDDGEKQPDAFAATTTYHASPTAILNNKVMQIVSAVQQLDPYIRNRGRTAISGTPDFMSPEQSHGTETDPDWLTYLYITTSRNHPALAGLLKPVVALGQKFLSNVQNLMNNSQHENAEMVARLDLRNFGSVQKAMEAIRQVIGQIKPEELKVSPTMAAVASSFGPFYTRFRVISPRVEQYLKQQYKQVQHLKWDQT